LIVLDKTASMNTTPPGAPTSKWGAAQLAIVKAIDQPAFDGTSLGLVAFPASKEPGPQCVFGIAVSCGISSLPQVALADSGNQKSNDPSGVRHGIYNYLVNAHPLSNMDDGSPVYEAMASAYSALRTYPNVDRRIAVLVTDGGFSCTSLSQRDGYPDLNHCKDWEEPPTFNALLKTAHDDATAPISTFIVGVPGSDSDGTKQGNFDTPPYNMLMALSTYAVSGSPETVDPACDQDLVFDQSVKTPPAHPCHIDLSNGGMFDANTLANAISRIRGQALGCVYDLPVPPKGKTINLNLVNVLLTLNGAKSTIPRRSVMTDTCASSDCWDFNANNQVELIGKACADLTTATTAKIDIEVGCKTVIK